MPVDEERSHLLRKQENTTKSGDSDGSVANTSTAGRQYYARSVAFIVVTLFISTMCYTSVMKGMNGHYAMFGATYTMGNTPMCLTDGDCYDPTVPVTHGVDFVELLNLTPDVDDLTFGVPEFSTTYGGYQFQFINDANRQAFDLNPSFYAPQYNGLCSFGAACHLKYGNVTTSNGEVVTGCDLSPLPVYPGDSATYLRYNNATYLFNYGTRDMFVDGTCNADICVMDVGVGLTLDERIDFGNQNFDRWMSEGSIPGWNTDMMMSAFLDDGTSNCFSCDEDLDVAVAESADIAVVDVAVVNVAVVESVVAAAKPKVILHIMADDLGWANVGFHNEVGRSAAEVVTPNIDRLVGEGLELERMYTEKVCAPSRASLLSGRFGIHSNVQIKISEQTFNLDDPIGGYSGIPLNMTTMAKKMQDAGYKTSMVGKWDAGMATQDHTPAGRGFDTWLGFFGKNNDYWTLARSNCPDPDNDEETKDVIDLWRQDISAGIDGPAIDVTNSAACSNSDQSPTDENGNSLQCEYEETIFVKEVKDILTAHAEDVQANEDAAKPLFLYYSMHLVHTLLLTTEEMDTLFSYIDDPVQRKMTSMAYMMDLYVGEIERVLLETGLWDDTLLVFHSDNGGDQQAESGGKNTPLLGGKGNNFEGGIRVPGFVTGGYLPENMRGTKTEAMISIADWYSTYLHAAGVSDADVTDTVAEEASLPALDSANCLPVILGKQQSCRDELVFSSTNAVGSDDGDALVGALISGDYKLVVGVDTDDYVVEYLPLVSMTCSRNASEGCLFDIMSDPYETTNLAESESELFYTMLARLDEIEAGAYNPDRGEDDVDVSCGVAEENGWVWGPFLPSPVW